MFVQETTVQLLCHFERLKALLLLIQKAQRRVYRFVLGFSLEGNVFDADEVDLEWVQLFPIEFTQERLLTFDLEI